MHSSEKKVENEIKEFIWNSGGFVAKIHAGAETGKSTLDLIGGMSDKPFLVEVKRAGGVASPSQKILVKRAKGQGYISGIVQSLDEFKALFDD